VTSVRGLWVHERAPHADGDGPLVVLVHGSMDRSTSFVKVERRLGEARVVRYDRRGYGRSLDTGPATSLDEQVDDLLAIVDERVGVVAGHSLGGVLALAAAVRRPDLVRAVVGYESPMAWREWWPDRTAGGRAMAVAAEDPEAAGDAAERFMRGIVGDSMWQRLPPSTRAQRRAEGMALVADLRSIRDPEHPPYEPAELTVPVIAAHGTESVPHHIDAARSLAAEAPFAELHVVDGAGHGVHRSDADAFAALVRRAIERAGLAAT
jgi:pimeloyl-ACP methyl ester carboxylesterase